jgi:hypothetical protein
MLAKWNGERKERDAQQKRMIQFHWTNTFLMVPQIQSNLNIIKFFIDAKRVKSFHSFFSALICLSYIVGISVGAPNINLIVIEGEFKWITLYTGLTVVMFWYCIPVSLCVCCLCVCVGHSKLFGELIDLKQNVICDGWGNVVHV